MRNKLQFVSHLSLFGILMTFGIVHLSYMCRLIWLCILVLGDIFHHCTSNEHHVMQKVANVDFEVATLENWRLFS